MTNQLPPLSLYIHLPWCVRKCPYCDFNSHAAGDKAPFEQYVTAILADLAAESRRAGERTVESIYLGGGTPSLFSAAHIERILDAAGVGLRLADDCEVTMEMNPGTLERGDLQGFRSAGVNRVSIGAQSFDAGTLRVLGRIHGPEDIVAAFDDAAEVGFASINIDLMFALPGQSVEAAAADVAEVCGLAPPHVSYYQLTLEPNTEFYKRPPQDLPDDELAWEIQAHCQDLLAAAGYEQYEVSAFAKAGHRCRHNLNYWTFGDYLAVGAGAHGKLTDADGSIWRYQKPGHPRSYVEQMTDEQPPPTSRRRLHDADAGFEYLLNALRLPAGFSEAAFSARTGLTLDAIEAPLEKAIADGLLMECEQGMWRPTPLGFRFLNELQARFLP